MHSVGTKRRSTASIRRWRLIREMHTLGTTRETLSRTFIVTKRRYPLLVATAKELDKLTDRMDRGRTDKSETPIRNDAVLQLVRDCFDMFVIDLASIREGLIERAGLLNRLKMSPEVLKRCDDSPATTSQSLFLINSIPALPADIYDRRNCRAV